MSTFLTLTSLALVDAINPCTLTIQALLLSVLVLRRGKRRAIIGGLLFSLTIFVMYFLYGLGILKFINFLGNKYVYVILNLLLLLMFGAELLGFINYKPGMRSMEMPLFLRPYAKRVIEYAESMWMLVVVAVLCSVFLLPCSSGPYVSALLVLSHNPVVRIVYLIYYNLIFILPLILITLVVGYGLSPKKIIEWKEKHIRELHLIAALLLLFVLVYFNYSYYQGGNLHKITPFEGTNLTGGGALYLIYSPTCPHCHTLISSLSAYENVNVVYLDASNRSVSTLLDRAGIEWDGGVPLLLCISANRTYAIEGYPTDSQNKDGYFMGRDYEEEMCKRLNGEEVYEDGVYRYCVYSNGVMVGNEYSLKYIVEKFRKGECKKIL